MPQEQSEHCSPELSAYVEIDVTEDSSDDNCVIEQCIIRHRKRGSTNSVDLKNEAPTKNPGSSLPLKKRLSCCVFHGWTEFVAINAISARVIACFKAWQQNPYQCELCVKLLERFIDAAAAQNYTIDSIDYPESSVKPSSCQRGTPTDWRRPPAKASIAPSGKHVQTPVSKTDCFATRDEFRVRATCRRSHTFLCTGAHLKANLWCPICALRQELGGTLNKRTSKSEVKAQESFSQLQQKRLFEEARELFLNTARSSGFQRRDTDPLPPSFKHPKQNVSFPLKISSDANPAVAPRRSPATLQAMAATEASRFPGVAIEHVLPLLQVLNSGSDPKAVLQIPSRNCTLAVAKAAYHRLARIVHPDKNPHPCAKEVFLILHNAWHTVKESLSRKV